MRELVGLCFGHPRGKAVQGVTVAIDLLRAATDPGKNLVLHHRQIGNVRLNCRGVLVEWLSGSRKALTGESLYS